MMGYCSFCGGDKEVGRVATLCPECLAKMKMFDDLVKAFEEYIENTVGEYGESRMFDCGVKKARKVIEKAKGKKA